MSVLDRKNITMVNGVIGPKIGQRWSGMEEIVRLGNSLLDKCFKMYEVFSLNARKSRAL